MAWKQRDGTLISVRAMRDSHLIDAIKMCRKKFAAKRFFLSLKSAISAFSYAESAPDGAAMAAQESGNWYMTQAGKDFLLGEQFEPFRELIEEASRRGIETF